MNMKHEKDTEEWQPGDMLVWIAEEWQPGDMLVWTGDHLPHYNCFFLVLSDKSYLIQKYNGSAEIHYVSSTYDYFNHVKIGSRSSLWKRM